MLKVFKFSSVFGAIFDIFEHIRRCKCNTIWNLWHFVPWECRDLFPPKTPRPPPPPPEPSTEETTLPPQSTITTITAETIITSTSETITGDPDTSTFLTITSFTTEITTVSDFKFVYKFFFL